MKMVRGIKTRQRGFRLFSSVVVTNKGEEERNKFDGEV